MKNKIAIVFNKDNHDESGEHWISMYIDCKGVNMRQPCIYFFDSVGEKEPEEITEFIEKVKEQGDKNGSILPTTTLFLALQTRGTEIIAFTNFIYFVMPIIIFCLSI